VTKEVKKYIESYDAYQRKKNRTEAPAGKLMPNAVPEKHWSHIMVDFITKLPLVQGYNTILVVYDRMTKIVHFVPTTEKTLAKGVARLFQDNIWKLHGLLESIIMDRGAQFAAGMIREFNQMLGIDTKLSTAYHSQIDSQMERMNQELEQYLRMFIDYCQEQWPDWLVIAEFVYNNKVQTSMRVLSFKANSGQDPYIGFEIRKKGKFEKAKAVLRKSQEEMRKYTDRKRSKPEEYRVGDWVFLSTKDLKFQMQGRHSEKLTEQFVGPYKVKRIISTNMIKLELPSTMKMHPVINISRVYIYKDQVEGQRKEWSLLVVIKGEEEYKVEKILNKRKFRGKDRYLVQWKIYTAEEDTWEPRESLGNARDFIEKFEEKYREESR